MTNEEIRQLLQDEAKAVLSLPITDQYQKAIDLIVEQVNHKGGNS